MENLKAPDKYFFSTPIAFRTCDGSTEREVQAEPLPARMPYLSSSKRRFSLLTPHQSRPLSDWRSAEKIGAGSNPGIDMFILFTSRSLPVEPFNPISESIFIILPIK